MGHCRADDPAGETRWAQTLDQRARSLEWDFLRAVDRMPWKALPKDLPPKSTVHDYLELWNWDGTLERIHHALYVASRQRLKPARRPRIIDLRRQGVPKKGFPILQATTRARRSKVASGTFWSTHWASC